MSTRTLYRIAAVAGLLCALALCFNAARRGGLLPTNEFTRGLAPMAQLLGLPVLTALYLHIRPRAGTLGLVGYAANSTGLAGLVGAEYVINFVFPYLPPAQVTALIDGATGTMFTITQVLFLLGATVFAVALARSGSLPALGAALYLLGAIPIGLRGVLPDVTVNPGVVIIGLGIGVLAYALLRNQRAAATAG